MFNRSIPICKLNKIADTIGMNIRLMKKDNCKNLMYMVLINMKKRSRLD